MNKLPSSYSLGDVFLYFCSFIVLFHCSRLHNVDSLKVKLIYVLLDEIFYWHL